MNYFLWGRMHSVHTHLEFYKSHRLCPSLISINRETLLLHSLSRSTLSLLAFFAPVLSSTRSIIRYNKRLLLVLIEHMCRCCEMSRTRERTGRAGERERVNEATASSTRVCSRETPWVAHVSTGDNSKVQNVHSTNVFSTKLPKEKNRGEIATRKFNAKFILKSLLTI